MRLNHIFLFVLVLIYLSIYLSISVYISPSLYICVCISECVCVCYLNSFSPSLSPFSYSNNDMYLSRFIYFIYIYIYIYIYIFLSLSYALLLPFRLVTVSLRTSQVPRFRLNLGSLCSRQHLDYFRSCLEDRDIHFLVTSISDVAAESAQIHIDSYYKQLAVIGLHVKIRLQTPNQKLSVHK